MMPSRSSRSDANRPETESYFGLVANLFGMLLLLVALVYVARSGPKPVAKIVATVLPKTERSTPVPAPCNLAGTPENTGGPSRP